MKKIAPVLILIISLLLSCLSPAAAVTSAAKGNAAETGGSSAASATDTPAPAVTNDDGLTVPDITAQCVVLTDLDTGKMIYSKNMDTKAYPASLTKMMTVLLAVKAVEDGKKAFFELAKTAENGLAKGQQAPEESQAGLDFQQHGRGVQAD